MLIMATRIGLDQGWQLKQSTQLNEAAVQDYIPVSQFPTVSILDLLHHNLVPDPYVDKNELKTLWVNEADWTYRTQEVPAISLEKDERAVIVFEGLDTVVDVFLNDKHILFSKNMHLTHRVDITDLCDAEKPSTLELRFQSAVKYSQAERDRIGYKGTEGQVHYPGSERLFLRKAQYHWGWDWGPTINTCGPWMPIYIEKFTCRIQNVLTTHDVAADLKTASVSLKGSVENYSIGEKQALKAELVDASGKIVLQKDISPSSEGAFEVLFEVTDPELWYPFMYGAQPMYTARITFGTYSTFTVKVGLRRLRILEQALKEVEGTSFVFEINNVRIFCGGSCWIPGDCILPRMTTKRYEDWIMLAKSGNQTMIRVWGGGIVEDDVFFEICDREGVLVWQDFLFACGDYPAHEEYLRDVKEEAEGQMMRVGHHPSLVIWAGNNEDYMLAKRWGWEYDATDEVGPWDKTNFPARIIYERLLPEIHSRLGGNVPYVRSSPYGGSFSNDPTVGDTHIWDVWHGIMAPYQDYKAYTSRFVSEFGFESAPDIRTVHKAITDPKERFSQSSTWDIHDKAPGNTRRYGMYMSENFRFVVAPMENYVYCTQFLQAEAMAYAYNIWRRQFRGPGEENCAGALVWQLNDVWPGMSWAVVDVDLNPKAAFYVIKRALAPVVVGMERTVTKPTLFPQVINYVPEKAAADIWAVNGHVRPLDVVVHLAAYDVETGAAVALETTEIAATLPPNRATEVGKLAAIPNSAGTVVVARLCEVGSDAVLARWVSWPEPLKFLHFAPGLTVTAEVQGGGESVLLSANAPAKGVVLAVPEGEGEDARWGDNFVDLVPGERVCVKVQGLGGRSVRVRWLCDWE